MNWLVVGCGDVGTRLGIARARLGDVVWGVRRSAGLLPPDINPISLDITRQDLIHTQLSVCAPNLDIVAVTVAAPKRDAGCYQQTYVDGVSHVLSYLVKHAPRLQVVFFSSSTAVYGEDQGEWVDEESPTVPRDFSGERLIKAEHECERLARLAAWQLCVIRYAGLYGPGRHRMIQKARAMSSDNRSESMPHAEARWTNRIHVEDAANLVSYLATLQSRSNLYVAVDNEPATEEAVLRWIAQKQGLNIPPPSVDPTSLKVSGKRCSNAKLRATGFRFRYPSFREGYAELLGP